MLLGQEMELNKYYLWTDVEMSDGKCQMMLSRGGASSLVLIIEM